MPTVTSVSDRLTEIKRFLPVLLTSLLFGSATVHASALLTDATILGNAGLLTAPPAKTLFLQSMLIATIGASFLYLTAIFSQNKQSRHALWLMLMTLGAFIFFLSTSDLIGIITPSQPPWFSQLRSKLTYAGLTLASGSLFMFHLTHSRGTILKKHLCWITAIHIVLVTLIAISPAALLLTFPPVLIGMYTTELLACIYLQVQAIVCQRPFAVAIFITLIAMLAAIAVDADQNMTLDTIPMTSLYCLIFFIAVQSIIIARKFSEVTNLAENLTKNLKNEVDIRTAELNTKNKKLEQTQRDLQQANESLKKLSITDGLTRIYNRMYFEQEFRKEWRRSARLRKSISILMIDVDHFKQLNDRAGHLAGDQALSSIAYSLQKHFKRAGELVARYGGEEFVAMLLDTDQRKALAVAEGFRTVVEKLAIEHNEKTHRVTVSIGISTTTPSIKLSPDHLLAAADSALYAAKNGGRNRVEIIPLLSPSSSSFGHRQPR